MFKNRLQNIENRQKNQMFLEPDSLNYDVFGPSFLTRPNGKIVIFGLPKCGNTWLQAMLSQYFDVSPVKTPEQRAAQGVLSIHDPFNTDMLEREDYMNGVCLIRDIRDLITSYYHYGLTEQFRGAMTRFHYNDYDSFYYEWFLSRCVPCHDIHDFADDFAMRGVPVLRYERLHSQPEQELSRLIRRWGFDVDEARIKNVVENNTLDRLKKEGLDLGYKVEATHFRKGGWGNFLTEMPPHIIEDVNERFEAYLSRWGYPVWLDRETIEDYQNRLEDIQ